LWRRPHARISLVNILNIATSFLVFYIIIITWQKTLKNFPFPAIQKAKLSIYKTSFMLFYIIIYIGIGLVRFFDVWQILNMLLLPLLGPLLWLYIYLYIHCHFYRNSPANTKLDNGQIISWKLIANTEISWRYSFLIIKLNGRFYI
jgi:hypothetical protein